MVTTVIAMYEPFFLASASAAATAFLANSRVSPGPYIIGGGGEAGVAGCCAWALAPSRTAAQTARDVRVALRMKLPPDDCRPESTGADLIYAASACPMHAASATPVS